VAAPTSSKAPLGQIAVPVEPAIDRVWAAVRVTGPVRRAVVVRGTEAVAAAQPHFRAPVAVHKRAISAAEARRAMLPRSGTAAGAAVEADLEAGVGAGAGDVARRQENAMNPRNLLGDLAMNAMKRARTFTFGLGRAVSIGVVMIAAAAFGSQARAADAAQQTAAIKKNPAAAKQKTYATPEEAVKDLMAAVKLYDPKALLPILGPEAKPLVFSGDKVADREGAERFLRSYEEGNKLEKSGDAKAILVTGKDDWPFPIPIVKEGGGWRFDTKAGGQEILNRRIGRNELHAMQAVLAYVDAQQEYYLRNPQKSKLLQYAQKFISSPGKRDGLYYPTKAGEQPSPLGPGFESARAEGYSQAEEKDQPGAYHGYRYRILKAQGPGAPGGAYDYLVKGGMMGGFALIAWPATYGNSGVMTFLVNHDGIVYEKDLGPETAATAQKITKFDPDKSWSKVESPGKK
jgi:hypothetical protein